MIPPAPMQVQITSTAPKQDSGTVSWTTLANGDIRVFYRQNQAFNDNTYGTGSDAGWTKQGKTHPFNNLVGSDKADYVVYSADGSEMARFYQDYKRQPQGIADPFVPDAKDTGAAPALAIDPIIAPSPRPAAIVSTGAASNPLAAPPVPAPVLSPSPLLLIAPGSWIPAWKKDAKSFRSPQAFPGFNLSTMDLKSINMRTLMSMMSSTNDFQSRNSANSI